MAVEGLITDGALRILAIFDKPDPLEGPYFEESIYVTPSRLSESQQRAIKHCATEAMRALGLSHGPILPNFALTAKACGRWKLRHVRSADSAHARCVSSIAAVVVGSPNEVIGLEELLLRHSVGLPGSDAPRDSRASAVMMIPVPRSGVLESITGEKEARATANITELHITARVHDYISAWPEGSSYLGFLFAQADTPADAEAALREAHAKLDLL